MQLIDSHVNLHAGAFAEDREAVISRAFAAGVWPLVTICDRLAHVRDVLGIAEAHPAIFASVGAHPHHAKDRPDVSVEELIALARHPKVVAIGETGLDRHYNYSPEPEQRQSLLTHIKAARALDLPLILHTREADPMMAEILEESFAEGAFRPLLHCYTGSQDLADRTLALGGYVSFSGILTFKSATEVRAVAQTIPLDRVILETDCPYLAPVPHRGRRNEPALVQAVYEGFAALRGVELKELAEQVADNFYRLFHTLPRTAQP